MATYQAIRGAFAALVRAASVAGFLVVLSAVAVTDGPIDWTPLRMAGFGWRFWMAIANRGAAVGFGALIGCLILSLSDQSRPSGRREKISLYAAINVITLILLMFVPAIATVR